MGQLGFWKMRGLWLVSESVKAEGYLEFRNVLTDFNSKVIMGCQRKRERHLVI